MRAASEPAIEAANESADSAPRRKLAALLCADVAGFSRLMGADESGTYEALSRLRASIDPIVAHRGGRIVSTAGDGLLADFPSVVDALVRGSLRCRAIPRELDLLDRALSVFLRGAVQCPSMPAILEELRALEAHPKH